MSYHYIFTRMARIKKPDNPQMWRGYKEAGFFQSSCEMS